MAKSYFPFVITEKVTLTETKTVTETRFGSQLFLPSHCRVASLFIFKMENYCPTPTINHPDVGLTDADERVPENKKSRKPGENS